MKHVEEKPYWNVPFAMFVFGIFLAIIGFASLVVAGIWDTGHAARVSGTITVLGLTCVAIAAVTRIIIDTVKS